ncbi:cytochrome c [Polyangium aurulentum]|nr:cytochrome c [Polyangium aurulentum]
MDFERMVNQARYEYYEPSEYFSDGRAMREPPEGTVPADRALGEPRVARGEEGGQYVETIPVPLSRATLEVGRSRFETMCAPCHGVLGDGVSVVAHNMTLRKPPSLVASPVTELPAGRVYQVIANGYGLMPSYGQELGVADRWAVVAYVRALQVHAGVPLDGLPAQVRQRALEELQ